jgi:murein DD-endopeptidase MepM/ murein hydrolase activator NlpD
LRLLGRSVLGAGAVATAGAGVVVATMFLSVAGDMGDLQFVSAPTSACSVVPQVSGDPKDLTPDQLRAAQAIIDVGRELGVPPQGWTIALMAALQESWLTNIPYGDRDSVGLFQQRAAWAPFGTRMEPAAAARMFYAGGQHGQPGLLDVRGWESMALGAAAQEVQRSAFPFAYDKHEGMAAALVAQLGGADPADCRRALAPGEWALPVDPDYRLTSRFGPRYHPILHYVRLHPGLDLALPEGRPVYAATGGKVVGAGWGGAYGNLVKLQHADGVATWYGHLSRVDVSVGDVVAPGAVLGRIGSTGLSTGPHLHFEVRLNGVLRDPAPWLPDHGVPFPAADAGDGQD